MPSGFVVPIDPMLVDARCATLGRAPNSGHGADQTVVDTRHVIAGPALQQHQIARTQFPPQE
jgi:hypothetical protein